VTKPDLISCIVPVFNGERYLAAALDSILAQTWPPLEVIVVDDGSTDGTAHIAAGYGAEVSYIHQVNAGPAAARNRGLDAARGEFIAFLDADDLWHKEKLARQMARFEARPELDLCSAHAENFWSPDVKREKDRPVDHGLAKTQPGATNAIAARRALFDRIGPFDATLMYRDAMEWLSRAVDAGAVMETLPDVLVFRRLHRDNISWRRGGDDRDELLRSVKTILNRRRGRSKVDS
jgi:glycosyltransferase involved in cell wall biosynthesis